MPWLGAGAKPAKATRAKILWDRENLHIAADLDDADLDDADLDDADLDDADLYADVAEHDGKIWDNDVFEVFVKPGVDKLAYYECQVNDLNTQFDCFILRRGRPPDSCLRRPFLCLGAPAPRTLCDLRETDPSTTLARRSTRKCRRSRPATATTGNRWSVSSNSFAVALRPLAATGC